MCLSEPFGSSTPVFLGTYHRSTVVPSSATGFESGAAQQYEETRRLIADLTQELALWEAQGKLYKSAGLIAHASAMDLSRIFDLTGQDGFFQAISGMKSLDALPYTAPEALTKVPGRVDRAATSCWSLGVVAAEALLGSAGLLKPAERRDGSTRASRVDTICQIRVAQHGLVDAIKDARKGRYGQTEQHKKLVAAMDGMLLGLGGEGTWHALDFLKRLLRVEPERRMSAAAALHHPFLAGTRELPTAHTPVASVAAMPVTIQPAAATAPRAALQESNDMCGQGEQLPARHRQPPKSPVDGRDQAHRAPVHKFSLSLALTRFAKFLVGIYT